MKNTKTKIYLLISIILGLVNALPTNSLDSFRGVTYWIASAAGFMLGGFILGIVVSLIFSIFDKSSRRKIIPNATLIMMILLIIIIPVNFFGDKI